jgi:hypothetical protein
MDGEHSVACWYDNPRLRRYIADHASRLTSDEELRADLMQQAWVVICGCKQDVSEEVMMAVARQAQDTYYREQVPRKPKRRGNTTVAFRLDAEHMYWVNQCETKLKWPRSAVFRLIVERGTQSILAESLSS